MSRWKSSTERLPTYLVKHCGVTVADARTAAVDVRRKAMAHARHVCTSTAAKPWAAAIYGKIRSVKQVGVGMAQAPARLRAGPAGAPDRKEMRRAYDQQRYGNEPWRKWYKQAVWVRGARPAQLARQPLCEMCLEDGLITPATVVNHRVPHMGRWYLFIDAGNHQSLCKPHHDRDAQRDDIKHRREARPDR